MKTLHSFILALVAAVHALAAPAVFGASPEGKFEVVGKTLMPFASVFAKKSPNANRAFSLTLRIEQMTGLPAALVGARGTIDVEFPDRVRLRAPVLGQDFIICRDGETIWVWPGSKVAPVLEAARASGQLPPPDPKFKLKPFHLPVSEKELIFLPALFQVREYAAEPLDGVPCRVLDLQLMSELGRVLGVANWSARLWVRPQDQVARLALMRPGWQTVLRAEEVRFAPALPSATWVPTPEQSSDVLSIPPSQYQQLLKLLAGLGAELKGAK